MNSLTIIITSMCIIIMTFASRILAPVLLRPSRGKLSGTGFTFISATHVS